MDREQEIALLDEILGLRRQKSAYLDEQVTYSPVSRYADAARFAAEQAALFRGRPNWIAHSSELPDEGSFLRREFGGVPVLLTRDRDGAVHAFYNVCRHRGARLVEAEAGCRHRFSCPYHAWTWDNQGRLISAPHREQGFPDLVVERYGLKEIACAERLGGVWIQIDGAGVFESELDAFLGPIASDLAWLELDALEVFDVEDAVWACNWKVVVEGGLEAYHFRVAHAQTIAGMFHDNLSTYQMLGPHIRSVLAKRTVDALVEQPRRDWRIREHANLLYTLFPSAALLAQPDHVALVQFCAEAVDRTRIRLVTLVPRSAGEMSEKARAHWRKNHALTVTTLGEDFALGEKIQAGFGLGVNEQLTFGRFEGALERFNAQVDQACA